MSDKPFSVEPACRIFRNSLQFEHSLNLILLAQDTVVEAICDLMESGAPCEIVDGDNYYFSKRVLSKVGPLLDQRRAARRKGSMPPCVVCLIGPQSSGKSMLANSLWGCQFAVSEGRCTRGIYGSVVPANVEGEQDLFVLDTEGLLSIEKGDPEFDRFSSAWLSVRW